jgi:hypothetical protein
MYVHLGGLLDGLAGSHFGELELLDLSLGRSGTLADGHAKVSLHVRQSFDQMIGDDDESASSADSQHTGGP